MGDLVIVFFLIDISKVKLSQQDIFCQVLGLFSKSFTPHQKSNECQSSQRPGQ